MKRLRIDVSEMWDNLSGDNMGILFEAFIDESRALGEKWHEGNGHVTLQEKRAVGKFLVDIGAVQLQVKEEKKKGYSPTKVEVHCIRTHQEQPLLASRQDAEERASEEEEDSAGESVITDAPISLPNGAPDVLYEDESDSLYSPSWSDESEDVSDEDDDAGFSGGNARSDVLLSEVNQVKKSEVTVSPPKCSPEVCNAKDANHDENRAVSSRVSQLEHDRMEGKISTIESSEVPVQSAAEMQAAVTSHKCTLCGSFFPSMWQLDLHVYKCKLLLYFYCPLCEKPYRKKNTLSIHLHRAHGMAPSEIIERLTNLAALPEEKRKKRILHGEASSKKRTTCRKSTAMKQDQKDNDFVPRSDETSKVRKLKKGTRINKDNPRLRADKKVKLAQSSDGIHTRSGAIIMKGSASVLDSCSNGEEEDVGSGLSSDVIANGSKEQVKNDPPEPGLIEGGNECDSHQKEQNDSKMECSEVGDSTLKEHLGPEDANDNMSAIRQDSPDDPGDISQGNSPTQKERKTESLDDDANSKQEQRQEQKSKGNICHLCGETFKTRRLLHFHIKTGHFGATYECSTCGKKFEILDRFKAHLEQHGDPEGTRHKCDICNASFKNKHTLLAHTKRIHVEKCHYTCEICHVVLRSKESLKTHTNSRHTKEVKYPCEQCDRVFYLKGRLMDHMEKHTGIRRWNCDQCDSSFYMKRDLTVHKRFVHVPSESYLCDLCGCRYKRERGLKEHYRTAHTDTFDYTCDVCGKKFKTKGLFKSHMKVHLDLRPHKCQLCEKSFRRAFILRVHMDWHNGVRAHKCSMCDMSFLTKGNLNKHMYKHQKTWTHSCDECDRAFPDLTALRRHLAKVHGIVVESKLTKAATRLTRARHGTKNPDTSNFTTGVPAVDALALGVSSIPSEPGRVLPDPDVVAAPELSTGISAHAETQGVSLGMDFVANNISCVEESIPAFNVAEEGQATEALVHMMLPSS